MSKFEKHFRIYLVSGHPAYIVDEEGNYYYFHRVTSSPKSGHHKNIEIDPNPDPTRVIVYEWDPTLNEGAGDWVVTYDSAEF